MKKKPIYYFLITVFLSLLPQVEATTLYTTSGGADPASGDFAFTGNAAYVSANGSAWRINDTGSDTAYYNVSPVPTATDFSDPNGWTFTANVQTAALPNTSAVYFRVADGQDWWAVSLLGTPGTFFSGTSSINLSTDSTATDFTTYQMYYDPSGDGGSGAVDFYIDGSFTQTIVRAQAIDNATRGITFGSVASGGTGLSDWAEVTFATGNAIPEPAHAAMLAGLCMLGVVSCVRRRTKP